MTVGVCGDLYRDFVRHTIGRRAIIRPAVPASAIGFLPGIHHLDAAPLEVGRIAGREDCRMARDNGGNLAVELTDRAASHTAAYGDARVGSGGGRIEWQNPIQKVLFQH